MDRILNYLKNVNFNSIRKLSIELRSTPQNMHSILSMCSILPNNNTKLTIIIKNYDIT